MSHDGQAATGGWQRTSSSSSAHVREKFPLSLLAPSPPLPYYAPITLHYNVTTSASLSPPGWRGRGPAWHPCPGRHAGKALHPRPTDDPPPLAAGQRTLVGVLVVSVVPTSG